MTEPLHDHWRPQRQTGPATGFEVFSRDMKGRIDVRTTVPGTRTGRQCKCGGDILEIARWGPWVCNKCCAGLGQT